MSKKNIQQPVKGITFTAVGMVIGLVFGGLVGILIGNPAIFAGGTMVLGLAIGSAIDSRNRGK